ncbi:hypothetical protein EVAR_37604_1 [Eumeta japonica]|uniref:Uncharacterized protein n=1 Tax=Eumeta variegata TaxID=151549 RepID=A0A4C1VNC1_EUMVA|nr:hypothetical protein EVAR_37604_1 [Eumeta japonica]
MTSTLSITGRREQALSRGKPAWEPPGSRWSSLPMDTHNSRGVTCVLPASCIRVRYLMVGGVSCVDRSSPEHYRKYRIRYRLTQRWPPRRHPLFAHDYVVKERYTVLAHCFRTQTVKPSEQYEIRVSPRRPPPGGRRAGAHPALISSPSSRTKTPGQRMTRARRDVPFFCRRQRRLSLHESINASIGRSVAITFFEALF